MFCVIYRSMKRDQAYLFIEKKDNFSRVPSELMIYFGKPVLSMFLPLDGSKKLASAKIERVKKLLKKQGFYLQVPPIIEDLLALY